MPPSPSPAKASISESLLDDAVAGLSVACAAVTGVGVPGLEPVVNGISKVATMIKAMKDNKKDLATLKKDLEDLKAKLDQVDTSGSPDLEGRLKALSDIISKLIITCTSYEKHGKFHNFFKGEDVKAKIEEMKKTLADGIQVFLLENDISLTQILQEQRKQLDHLASEYILSKLKPAPARYNAANTPDECMLNTCVDIRREIIDRLTANTANSRVVVLSGAAGFGKSTIAKSIASELDKGPQRATGQAEQSRLAASFFFSRGHEKRGHLDFIPSTVAVQLADFSPEFRCLLVKKLQDDKEQVHMAQPSIQFEKLVIDVLELVSTSTTPWFIVFDALDECDRGDTLVAWLARFISRIPLFCRFFITGRPQICSYFSSGEVLHPLTHQLNFDKWDASRASDVHLFVERSLDGHNWQPRSEWKVEASDAKTIADGANGVFIIAATAVRYIRDNASKRVPQKSVNNLLKGTSLRDVEEMYRLILDEAVPLDDQDAHSRYQTILGAILHVAEPFGVESLARLIGLDVEDVQVALNTLSAVIRAPKDGTVQFIHATFREFITGAIAKPPASGLHHRPDLICDSALQQLSVTTAVLRVMTKELRFNMCKIPTSYCRNADLKLDVDAHIPHHLRYSCCFWVYHLSQTRYHKNLAELIEVFFLNKLLFWLEALSLLGAINTASKALSAIVVWIAPLKPDVANFAIDAQKFVHMFGAAISDSAPHIYLSALPFAPKHSLISQHFTPIWPKIPRIHTGYMTYWPDFQTTLSGQIDEVTCIAWSPDGKTIVSGSWGCVIHIWDTETGKEVFPQIQGHTDSVTCIAFSYDGTHIVSGSSDCTIRVWDVKTGQEMCTLFEGHTALVTSVTFSPDGTQIVSGSSDSTIHVWDIETGKEMSTPFTGHTGWVTSVTFSPDGTHVASGSWDSTIRVWDVKTGKEVFTPFKGHTSWVNSIDFSPDGTCIVSGSLDSTICVWNIVTGKKVFPPLEGHTSWINSVAFSPDGAHIVSGSQDYTIRLWDAESGKEVSPPFEGHTESVTSVAFSPFGNHFVSGSNDGTIRVWDVESGKEMFIPSEQVTKSISSDNFSSDETDFVSGVDHYSVLGLTAQAAQVALVRQSECLEDIESVAGDSLIHVNPGPVRFAFSPNIRHALHVQEGHVIASVSYENSKSGWIVGPQHELLFWVPPDLRRGLWWPCNILVTGGPVTTLDLSHFAHGKSWMECYSVPWRLPYTNT